MSSLQRLGVPRLVRAELGPGGEPVRVEGRPVEAVRGRWIVEEGWWTDRPVRRRYLELLLDGGRLEVVYENLCEGGWYVQPGA
jgi:hypothetical protein